MVSRLTLLWVILGALGASALSASAQQKGSIRGVVRDRQFDGPVPGAKVLIAETKQRATTMDEGNYAISDVAPGTYTVVISKDGYAREVKSNVVVSAGQMTDVSASLNGDLVQMEKFEVQDEPAKGTESAVLKLRMENPQLVDAVSSKQMKMAGASDATDALKLVSGATVQGGKYATIRGLPDRYVNSQMNGVRLPTADADKRAVELDQFSSKMIETLVVHKTFTPDQQGDASGGAVNVILKGIPDESTVSFSAEYKMNTQVTGAKNFLSYDGGGVGCFGKDTKNQRRIQWENMDQNWQGAAGVNEMTAPQEWKWDASFGGKHRFDFGLTVGGMASFYYERDASHYDNGIDDRYWVTNTKSREMVPKTSGSKGDYKTSLYDTTQSTQEVRWGAMGALGIEWFQQKLSLHYMRTQSTEDQVTLGEDTRGKYYYFPKYQPNNSRDPGNENGDLAPFQRAETLQYTERATQTLQFSGQHVIPIPELGISFGERGQHDFLTALPPEFDWTLSWNWASMDQPDKRMFGSSWSGPYYYAGFPPWIPATTFNATHKQLKPGSNINMGNFQRIWKDIREDSNQFAMNFKLPFRQWTGDEGYVKFGWFRDDVDREYNQETFTNSADTGDNSTWQASWEERWSSVFPYENHAIHAIETDVDYVGHQEIRAGYWMADLPVCHFFNVIGGIRFESTKLTIRNDPDRDVTWFPPTGGLASLTGPEADVDLDDNRRLPMVGFKFQPFDQITFRGSYSETIARPTFKELTPILQVEYLGADVFVGNPDLQLSSLRNYDLRFDWTPTPGTLVSVSWFKKVVLNPIEYEQRVHDFLYTTPVNYPSGWLKGWELEVRADMGEWFEVLAGLTVGGNATWIKSEVTLPEQEAAVFEQANIQSPMRTRDMTNAPNHLYNFFFTYDIEKTGTTIGLFYTIRGDVLIAGAGQSSGAYIPNVYEKEFGTLNFTLSQKLNDTWTISFKAKNLLNPEIQTVYRSKYIGSDVVRTSYTKGIDFSLSIGAQW